MKFKSEIVTQASGSVGGVTYSRSKGGTLYRRARAIPVNPNTTFQTQVRSMLTDLVNRWTEVLSAAQRNAWNTYGQNVLFTNALGDPRPISGQNAYIGANTARGTADSKLGLTLGIIDDAPTIFDRGDFTTPVISAASTALGINYTFTNTDTWANEDGAAMLIFQGRPRNQSRLFFAGPWRLVGVTEGDSGTAPTSPGSVSAANMAIRGFTLVADQLCSYTAVVVRADGRWSSRRKLNDFITT